MSSTWKGNYPFAYGAVFAAARRAVRDLEAGRAADLVAADLKRCLVSADCTLTDKPANFDERGNVVLA